MKPTIFGTDAYQLFINLGTVFGSFAFFIAKYRRTKRIGQSFFSLAVCLAIFGNQRGGGLSGKAGPGKI